MIRTSVSIVLLPPTRSNFPSCRTRKHLALHARRHVADFIEEERAAGALLEFPDPRAVGSCKCSFLMAEELALQQRLRNRRAIDRQERRRVIAGCVLDRLGHQFFARAAFTQNQYVDLLRRHATDGLVYLLHRRTIADHRLDGWR